MFNTKRVSFKRSFRFKLASRIACLAVMVSAVLWLNASVAEASFSCITTQNTKTGACEVVTCGTSQGNAYWYCPPGGGQCTSDPGDDPLANMICSNAANGCPETYFYTN